MPTKPEKPTLLIERDVSSLMRRVHATNTTPEIKLRRALWAKGLRYFLHAKQLPGKPDIVFPRKRLAVFVDGDFWHGGQRNRSMTLDEQFKELEFLIEVR